MDVAAPDDAAAIRAWCTTPFGRYVLAWEQTQFDQAVANCFGYHALQLGLPELPALQANRMPHRWLAVPDALADGVLAPVRPALVTHAAALPFPEASLDLVVLPHTLEWSADPHAVLREVARVLVPEGKVVISAFNPLSACGGLRGCAAGLGKTLSALPPSGPWLAPWRLRDGFKLLGWEVLQHRRGCWRLPVQHPLWLQRCAGLDRWGPHLWPLGGLVHFWVAVKRVPGVRLLGPAWKPRRARVPAWAVASPRALTQKDPT